MQYELLRNQFYKQKYEDFLQEVEKRKNSPSSQCLPIQIHNKDSFFMATPEMLWQMEEIEKILRRIEKLCFHLPSVAVIAYLRKYLIEEIMISYEIEGVRSTRAEVARALDTNRNTGIRFYGLTKKYETIQQGEQIQFITNLDIKSIYEEIIQDEIAEDDWPDGRYYRTKGVSVISGIKSIHEGILPEEKIEEEMQKLLNLANDKTLPVIVRAALLQYFIGYIHPYYDGNGRLGRFLSTYLLSQEYHMFSAFRMSYAIKQKKNEYYKAFDICNDQHNYGDVTPFILTFLDIMKEGLYGILEDLEKALTVLDYFNQKIEEIQKCFKLKKTDIELLRYLFMNDFFWGEKLGSDSLCKLMDRSRNTIHNMIDKLIEKKIPIKIEKQGRSNIYSLDIEEFNKWSAKEHSIE